MPDMPPREKNREKSREKNGRPSGTLRGSSRPPYRTSSRKIDGLLSKNHRARRRTRGTAHPDAGQLNRLVQVASLREAWTAQLRALLPAELGAQCQVASLQGTLLGIHAQNAAWATRLRFLAPALLPELNRLADFATVREIRIRVSPTLTDAPEPSAPLNHGQPPNASCLMDLANTLDYGELREAVLRLARQGDLRQRPQSEPSDGHD